MNTLLAWAKCFLATYGVYPGLYDLLDTPRLDFLAAQLHLRDSTLPRPLLHRSRGPPTIRSAYVALQPHLAPPPHPDVCTSVARTVRPSPCQSVVRPVRPSSRQPHSLSITPQGSRTVRPSHRQSVRHPRPSVTRSVRPPSHHSIHDSSVRHPTRQSCATSVRPSVTVRLSVHHPTTSVRLSYVTPSARHTNQSVRPSATVPPSLRHTNQSVRPSATIPTSVRHPHQSVRPSATVTPSVRHTNQSVSVRVNSQLSDCHYDSSACTSVLPHDSPYPRLAPLPSSREWGAITHDSPYTRFEQFPSSREWGAILQGQEIP